MSTNSVHDVRIELTVYGLSAKGADHLVELFCDQVKRLLGNRLIENGRKDGGFGPEPSWTSASDTWNDWDYTIFCKVTGQNAKDVDDKMEYTMETVQLNIGSQLQVRGVEVDK